MTLATTPDISVARATPPWKQKLSAFWRWWTGELGAMLPERFARGSRVPVLAIEDGDVALVEPKSAAGPEARVALAALDPLQARNAVRVLLERAGETRGRARVRLLRDEALVRRVTMPEATEENLSQVIGFEMDRLTPFRAEDVYFDHQVVARDPAAATIMVQLAVARRDVVDARVAQLRELGVSVQGVAVSDDSATGAAAIDLLPTEQRGERESPNERLIKRALAAVVVVLLFVVLLLPAWQKRETVIALHPVLAKAEADAKATDALARELERQVADYNYLLAKKHTPPALAYLEEFSRLLPDSTWVQQFDLRAAGKGREVQITGETPSSSRLIELMEQSTLLHNAAPRGTVTRGSQPGTERFMIAAEPRPRALPEPRPATEIAAIVVTPPPAPAPPPAPPAAEPTASAAPPADAQAAGEPPPADAGEPPKPATARLEPVAPTVMPPVPADAKARRDALREQAKARAEARAKARDETRRVPPIPTPRPERAP